MAKFNTIQFEKETRKLKINSMRNIALNAALSRFNSLKLSTIEQFEDHAITKEIDAGPEAENTSNTLGGRGNLFSFLGFERGQKPIDIIRQALEAFIVMDKNPVIQETSTRINFKYSVRIPNLQTLHDLSPLNWESGKSWIESIEKGASGLMHYMYWKRFPNPPSRSGSGVQVGSVLRQNNFNPTVYMSKIINDLRKRLDA